MCNEIAGLEGAHAEELLPLLNVGFRNSIGRGMVLPWSSLWDLLEFVDDIDEVICVEVITPSFSPTRHDVDEMSERMDEILLYTVSNASEW